MKLRNIYLTCFLILTSSNIAADIESDITANLDIRHIINNATMEGMELKDIINTIATMNPSLLTKTLTTLLTAHPDSAEEIAFAAINATPQKTHQIMKTITQRLSPSESATLIEALIEAGHDPLLMPTSLPEMNDRNSINKSVTVNRDNFTGAGSGGNGTGLASPN